MKNTFVFKQSLIFTTVISSVLAVKTANATILTFSDLNLNNFGDIPVKYGDNVNSFNDGIGSYEEGNGFTPNVIVEYRTVNATDGSTISNNLDYWNNQYGNLIDVAFPIQDGTLGEISLTPDTGYFVKLNSFDLAGYPGFTQPNQTVRILDKNFNILVDYSPFDITGNGHNTFFPDILTSDIIRIQYGPSWNTGIDNINFDQQTVPEPPPIGSVPEPSTIIGLGILATFAMGIDLQHKIGRAHV